MQAPALETGAALSLADVLDLKAAGPLHGEILACRGQDLTLDASEVRRLGAQCLQVLAAAASAWRADGKTLRVDRPSSAFTQALQAFGVEGGLLKEPHA
jgi:chemotaxis protein CheX